MQELDELVARVDCIDSEAERSPEVIEETAAQIRSVEGRVDRADPEACYLVGYCWYNLPDHWQASKAWFRRSLDLRPTHLLSRLYLGHVLFDEGQYDEAQLMFRSVLPELLGPAWRRLKVEELDVCCELYLSAGERGTVEVVQLLRQYEMARDDVALPTELVRSVAYLCEVAENHEGLRSAMDAVISYAERSGYNECFAAELARIRVCCSDA